MAASDYERFEDKLETICNTSEIQEFLHWDQQVMMPEKSVKARSQQMSTLSTVLHNLWTDEEFGQLIDELDMEELSGAGQANFREARREYRKAVSVPRELKEKISQKQSESLDVWQRAKKESDFEILAPELEELVELKRQYANHIDPEEEPYKVLFKDYEPYLEFEKMHETLMELKDFLVDFIDQIRESGTDIETGVFKGEFSEEKQEKINRELAENLGYDYSRGRLDVSTHPFTAGNQLDCRITTRYNTEDLSESIMPTIHETGHALYEQGLPQERYPLPAGASRDMSVHESQSRLWENHVGRSREFQEFLLPKLKQEFPELEDVTVEDAFESLNQVYERNPIRVKADELTYHLHIVLRYEIERELINGEIEVEDLPELWNQKMEEYLGFRPENDAKGVLQDVHWSQGSIGYFPTYSLGSVLAAQLYSAAEEDIDDLEQKIERGNFESLLEWMRENVHSKGCLYETEDLIQEATGEELNPDHFISYVKEKYSELYNL